jgi:predicted dehydrogenase
MIRIAVIGAGHWGPNLIRNFHNKQSSEVGWVVDTDRSRLDMVAARFPEVKTDDTVEAAISDDSIDAVVIATPTSTHFDLAKLALERGKHVLVEKPITNEVNTAEQLCEIAEDQDVVLMVGHVFLFNAAVRRVKHYLEDDFLGQLYYITMVRTNLGPIRVDVNAAWDLAAHDISIANYWLESEPLTVSATGGQWINSGIEDAMFATMRYPDDVLVNLHVSWLNPRKNRDITLVGEQRMLTVDDMNLSEPLRIYDKRVTSKRTKASFVDSYVSFRSSVRDGDITIPRVAQSEPLTEECGQFVACIATGQRPPSDGRFGAGVVRVLEAIERSLRNGGCEVEVGG